MNAVRERFREVMHVHRNGATTYQPEHTVFSFVGNSGYVPYVTVPGLPPLQPGMEVVALLRRPGNWNTLIGWRDLTTGHVAMPDAKDAALRFAGMVVLAVVVAATVLSATTPSASLAFAGMLALAVSPSYLAYREYRRWNQCTHDCKAVMELPRA